MVGVVNCSCTQVSQVVGCLLLVCYQIVSQHSSDLFSKEDFFLLVIKGMVALLT